MTMRTLLWKDYRQNRMVLAAIGVLVAAPYLFACVLLGTETNETWASAFSGASMWAIVFSTLITAFVGGNAIAGERVDRSAEFAAYLPIERRRAVTSKAVLAGAVCVGMYLFNLAVLYTVAHWVRPEHGPRDVVFVFGLYGATTGVLLFGVSWLFSTISSSPPLAAVAGIGAAASLAGALAMIETARNPSGVLIHKSVFEWWYPALCVVIGLVSFVVGVVCYLRRVEP